jgi:hypothetical protein
VTAYTVVSIDLPPPWRTPSWRNICRNVETSRELQFQGALFLNQ